jgi:hypothetical protein
LDLFDLDVGNFNPAPPAEYNGSKILYPVNSDPTHLSGGGCAADGARSICERRLVYAAAMQCANYGFKRKSAKESELTYFALFRVYPRG